MYQECIKGKERETVMKKKLVSVVLAAAVAAGTLAGCGGSSTKDSIQAASAGGETTDKSSSDEDITLRFAWWGGDERNEATLKVIEQFEAAHPNITIEAEYGGSDGYHDKLATQLASGTAADIVQVDPEVFPTYVTTGDYFIDYKDYDMDLSNFDENYISLEINGRYDGKQLGLPTGISGSGMLVNKDLADAIGIDFTKPYTWDDMIEMGKKVRAYDDSMYLLCANKEYLVNMVVFNYGKQLLGKTFFDADAKTLNLTEDDLKTVYEYVKQLYDEEVVAPASYQASYTGDSLQSDTNWIAGKYVAAPTYISTIDVMVAANPEANYVMGQLPALDGAVEKGWASNTPQVIAITKTCEHPEAAVEFAMFLNRDLKGINLIRTLYYIPSLFGGSVAVALLWRLMFLDNGVINAILTALHLPVIQWLGDTRYALRTICMLEIWQFGSSMVMFLAALKQVPRSLYEAAEIDGAGKVTRFFHITLPQISPIIFFNLINQTIQALQNFTSAQVITEGGPLKSTYVLGLKLYKEGFSYFKMGYASAISWVVFAAIMIFTLAIFASSKLWVHYADE